ncbi:glycosyltransferase [bacterium]|nr:glycosyltransferase [bacterium]
MESETKITFISVIIPVFNGADYVDKCLISLGKQSISRNCYEIIVVDDGSNDGTPEKVKSICDKLIQIENSGPAVARNRGAQSASGQILLFTDADCIPEPDWIEKMSAPFQKETVSGTKGAYLTYQTQIIARFIQSEYESKYNYMSKHKFIDFIDTYSAGFRRNIFLKLGGFNENFPGASVEDQEFSFRMAEAGYKMVFLPEARVYHRHAQTLTHYFRKKFNIGYWKVLVLHLHPEKTMKDTHTPQTLKLQLPLSLILALSIIMFPSTGITPGIISLSLFIILGRKETWQCVSNRFWAAAFFSPIIMWFRSVALGLGLIWGLISPPDKKIDLT